MFFNIGTTSHFTEVSSSDTQYITDETYESQDETGEVNKMYVELLSKQLSKPVLQTQELKLIKEDGENHYMIVTQDEDELNEDNTIVTKQNNDGTISLTTVKGDPFFYIITLFFVVLINFEYIILYNIILAFDYLGSAVVHM